MKSQAAVILLLALVPNAIAFFPYTPSWMCDDGKCLALKRSDGAVPMTQDLNVIQEGQTLKLHRRKSSRSIQSRESKFSERSVVPKNNEQLEKRGGDILTSPEPTQAGSAAIDQDSLDYSYFASIGFGSNQTPLYMLLDTGSFLTWVPATGCESLSCLNPTHSTYGPENSTTYNITGTKFDLAYGTGTVSGLYASDSLSFAGLTMDLFFGAATTTSEDFNNFPFDGILGLGNALNYNNYPTFMGVVTQNKLLKSNIFGINLSRAKDVSHDGEINFGAPDTSKYNGSLTYTPVIQESGSWSIALDDAGYNGKSVGFTGRQALIDTGTSYIILPSADAAQLFALVDNVTIDESNTTYIVPCDITTPIQFTFSGVSFDISSEDWIGPVIDSTNNLCASNIYPLDGATSIQGEWLLGDTFLKNVYSVFDCDQNRIGFGAKTGSSAVSSTATASSSATGTASPSESPLLPAGASATSSGSSSKASQSASSTSSTHSSSTATTQGIELGAAISAALFLGLSIFML